MVLFLRPDRSQTGANLHARFEVATLYRATKFAGEQILLPMAVR